MPMRLEEEHSSADMRLPPLILTSYIPMAALIRLRNSIIARYSPFAEFSRQRAAKEKAAKR